MRQPEEIDINGKTLRQVLDEHKLWRNDEGGECANLYGADLRGANLGGAEAILSIGPMGSRGDVLIAVQHESAVMVKAGCFWGTLAEFAAKVMDTHGKNKHARDYKAAIALIETFFAED